MGTITISALRLCRLVELRHEFALCGGALLGSRWLSLVPNWLLHLRLCEPTLLQSTTHIAASIYLDISLVILLVFFGFISGSSMDSILPALIELRVFASNMIMQDWCMFNRLKRSSRMLPVNIFIATWAAHFDHIHNVLGIRIFLLPQVKLFEFLPHWWVMSSCLNIAERAQWLLSLTIFFGVREALVLFNISESHLFFCTKIDVIERFVWKPNQIRSDCQRELSERYFAIRLVAEPSQDGIHILFQNLLLELEQEVFDILEVEEAEVTLINHAKDWYCVELFHSFERFLLDFDLDVVVDLFFKESGEFKLDVCLQSIIPAHLIISALRNLRS